MKQEELAKKINVCRDIIIFYEKNKEYRQINQRTMDNYRKIFEVLEMKDKVKLHGYEKFILTGQKFNFMGENRIVESNELMIAIKG